jgi:hypothetical protein
VFRVWHIRRLDAQNTVLRSPACHSNCTSLVGLMWPLHLDLDLRDAFLDEANLLGGSP